MTEPSIWWFVSDLHLQAQATDDRGIGQVFPEFVSHEVLTDARPDRHLVLLGDTFAMRTRGRRRSGGSSAREQVADVVDRYPGVFDALRTCIQAGVTVHAVCGDHDVALAGPGVRELLLSRLTAHVHEGDASRFRLHPWLVHEPGLLYAEHGHQHCALNRYPALLAASEDGPSYFLGQTPRGAWTAADGAVHRARDVVSAWSSQRRAERTARGTEYESLLRAAAEESRLPDEAMLALHAAARFHGLPAAATAVQQRLPSHRGPGHHPGLLHGAAIRVDAIVAAAGPRPLCYVFGHSRRPALVSLAGSRVFYASAGSWAHLADEVGPRQGARFPYIEVTRENLGRRVRLAYWRARSGDGGGPSPGASSSRPPMAPHRPAAAAVGSGPETSRGPRRLR